MVRFMAFVLACSEGQNLSRGRVLVVEDEVLVAMEQESILTGAGFDVVGPAESLSGALEVLGGTTVDAAIVDANLAGRSVNELAAALTRKRIPFAFVSGYGREGLPAEFRTAVLLGKPYTREQLLATVERLLEETVQSAEAHVLRK